ncbi:MAG: hypothetical protein L3J06_00005 [Cyclobacteriaceae bacterium]|nr:hypothetical protein [Cyclobacteriaceae bacterium]
MIKYLVIIFAFSTTLFIISCSDDPDLDAQIESLDADFTIELSSETVPSELTISNNSTGAESYSWTFQGGTPENSSEENPGIIVYDNAGDFTVSLTITSGMESNTHEILFSITSSKESEWSVYLKKGEIPFSNRYGMVSFVIDKVAYMGGGTTTSSSSGALGSFYALDLETKEFTQINTFPGGSINWGVGFSINNMGYVGSGNINGVRSNQFYKYDPSTGEWSQITDFPGTERNWTTLVVHEGKAYYGLGAFGGSSSKLDDFWVFDPNTEQWDELAPFPGGIRHSVVGFSVGSLIYAGGGTNVDNDVEKDFWSYNPSNNSWAEIANLPEGLTGSSSASFNNYGYLMGGQGSTTNKPALETYGINTDASNAVYQYDPINNSWQEIIEFPYMPRSRALSFIADEKIYYGSSGFLSVSSGWINDNEIYVFNP